MDAGGRCTDDEDVAGRKLIGVPVVRRNDLKQVVGQSRGDGRHPRHVAVPGRDDDVSRHPDPAVGGDAVAPPGQGLDSQHGGAVVNRRVEGTSVVLQVLDELPRGHVTVGVVPLVVPVRKTTVPVGREEPQGIPALAAPALADPPALQHDVLDAALPEAAAHGQARLTASDDDRVRVFHGLSSFRCRQYPTWPSACRSQERRKTV